MTREACEGLKIEDGEAKCYILIEEVADLHGIAFQLSREMQVLIHNRKIQNANNFKCFSIHAMDAQHTRH